MIVYIGGHGAVGGKSKGHLKVQEMDHLGFMFTPFDYRRNYSGRIALDNGAFSAWISGTDFNEEAFLKILSWISGPDFVILPDKVAAGKISLDYSVLWREFLPDRFTYYLAVQDGMNQSMLKPSILERIGGLFVGGSMDWKMRTSESWCKFAHENDLLCHIGRIGTLKGLMWAERIGSDSVDSTNFAQHQKNWLELLEWSKKSQMNLEVEVA